MLRRFWFTFPAGSDANVPPMLRLGCGVTARDRADALVLLKQMAFRHATFVEPTCVVDDVDVSTLEANHVLPNCGVTVWRGVWYPNLGAALTRA